MIVRVNPSRPAAPSATSPASVPAATGTPSTSTFGPDWAAPAPARATPRRYLPAGAAAPLDPMLGHGHAELWRVGHLPGLDPSDRRTGGERRKPSENGA